MLAELCALFVGIRCLVDVLMQRRDVTGWSRQGPFIEGTEIAVAVERWSSVVRNPGVYDIEIDTSRRTPGDGAARIRSPLEGGDGTALAKPPEPSIEPRDVLRRATSTDTRAK